MTLDYLDLVTQARRLDDSTCGKSLRLAILADVAVQHLAPLLRVLFVRKGVRSEIYEAGYATVDLEVVDANSALYQFRPDVIVILNSSEKAKSKLYQTTDRGEFAAATVGRLSALWTAVQANCPATIIQTTYVQPSERAFGNYELKVSDSVCANFPG